jgi:magnesium chelatase family protein
LLDRIDIHIEVTPVSFNELSTKKVSEKSADIRARVIEARKVQSERFKENKLVHCNAQMSPKKVRSICIINEDGNTMLKNAMEKLGLSARAYDRILKVARTIADLEQSTNIELEHLAEAINYRSLDRDTWQVS